MDPVDSQLTVLERAAHRRGAAAELGVEGRRALEDVVARLLNKATISKVGRYELGDKLGEGGCGVVFEAYDPKLDRKVALKVVLPTLIGGGDDKPMQRLVREAQALAKLGHPNIVEVFDVGTDNLGSTATVAGGVYIVMELVEGPTLRRWQRERGLAEVVDVYMQAARGLAAAHEVGVVHRDFKPANVMIAPGRRAKVLDFGLARDDSPLGEPTDDDARVISADGPALTGTGVVMGTPRYMAPEQHSGGAVTPAADQYAFCVSLWEARAGGPPFDGERLEAIAAQKRRGPPPQPDGDRLPLPLYRVLARGLDPEPGRRFPDMHALATALEAAAGRRRWRRPVAVGAVAAAIGLAGWMAGGVDPPPAPKICSDAMPQWQPRIDQAFEAVDETPRPAGGRTAQRVRERAERFATGWRDVRQRLCEASTEATADDFDAAAACLTRAAEQFDGVLGLYARATPGDEFSAGRRLWSLVPSDRCLGDRADDLYRRTPAQDRELDEINAKLLRHLDTGMAEATAAEQMLQHALERADALDDTTTAAYALMLLGLRHAALGQLSESAKLIKEAAWRAEAAGHLLLAAELLPDAISFLQSTSAPPKQIDALLAHADDVYARAAPGVPLAVYLEEQRMLVLGQRGHMAEAKRVGEAALEMLADHPVTGTKQQRFAIHLMLAQIDWEEGLYRSAATRLDTALAVPDLEPEVGRASLAIARALRGAIALEEGDEARAVRELLSAIRYMNLPFEHPDMQSLIALYGFVLNDLGSPVEGLAHLERAIEVLVDEQAGQSAKVVTIAGNLAKAHLRRKDWDAAVEAAGAYREFAERLAMDSGQAEAYFIIARAQIERGDLVAAEVALERGLALAEPSDEETIVDSLLPRAALQISRGQWDEAEASASRVLEHLQPAKMGRHARQLRADAYSTLARIARLRGENEAADELDRFAVAQWPG